MKERLKILQVCNRLPFPLNDGGNIATYYVTRFLIESGHRVRLAALNTVKHYQSPEVLSHLTDTYTIDIDTRLRVSGLIKGLFSDTPYNVERFRSHAFETLLKKLVEEEAPDIIQLEGSYLGIYVPALRNSTKALIVLRSHNVEHQIWSRMAASETNLFKRLYLNNLSPKIRKFEEDTLHLYDAILAITPLDAAYYKAHGFNGPILHFPAGVLVEGSRIEQSKPYDLGFLGSMEWLPNQQGVEWFIEKCWKKILEKNPDRTFYIAGKHIPENWWVRNQPGVMVLGEVTSAAEFMRQCKLFVVPLLSGGGMRVKIIEAMAQGATVLTTHIGAEGIEAEHGVEIWLADQPSEMISAIDYLLQENELRDRIGNSAYSKVVTRYNWKTIIQSLEEFYVTLLKKNVKEYSETE